MSFSRHCSGIAAADVSPEQLNWPGLRFSRLDADCLLELNLTHRKST